MSEKNTPGATGQDTGLNDPTLHVDIREELAALQRDIASVHIACERLHAHVIASHGEREPAELSEAEAEPDSAQAPEPPHVPPLALRCDGKTLVSVTQFGEMDLSTRERWEGVVLTEAEAFDVLDRISDACDDAAGHVAGRILWKKDKPDDESGEGGDEQ